MGLRAASLLLSSTPFRVPANWCSTTPVLPEGENAFFSDFHGIPTAYHLAVSVTIGLEGANNDQFGRGAWRTMHVTGDPIICPRLALKHIMRARRSLKSGSRFLCGDLDAKEVTQAFKYSASTIGVRQGSYSTHSIRIGGATALLNGKADSLSIKLFS
jgi:hypothetical protein